MLGRCGRFNMQHFAAPVDPENPNAAHGRGQLAAGKADVGANNRRCAVPDSLLRMGFHPFHEQPPRIFWEH